MGGAIKIENPLKSIAKSLHPLERKLLPLLKQFSKFSELVEKSHMKDVEVMRALQWLQSKAILELKEDVRELVILGENGKKALETDLPEKLFLRTLIEKPKSIDEIMHDTVLTRDEINACIGLLKSRGAIDIAPGMVISMAPAGKLMLSKESPEESLLHKIRRHELQPKDLVELEKLAYENLRKRKGMISTALNKEWHVVLTKIGSELSSHDLSSHYSIEKLTPEMLKDGSWKGKEFRAYDMSSSSPRIARGKRHFFNQARSSAKRIWLDMGFKEMTGPMVQTSFWNFDALFTAQDHPVREMQDTFFIKSPATGSLPDKKIVDKVRRAHEDGGDTGSIGWQYKWDEALAKKNVLRTHTTALSARTIASLKTDELPVKYFVLDKCYRNETVDWSHLFEFNQNEGIVVDKKANFRHLLGYLKAFFKKMGYEKARFRPAYFPYTEFSVEIDIFHPARKRWVELGGAGIFRPEVVKPLLGADIPVLAWGPGFDRIILDFFKITDIRDLYRNDLKQLREMKDWML